MHAHCAKLLVFCCLIQVGSHTSRIRKIRREMMDMFTRMHALKRKLRDRGLISPEQCRQGDPDEEIDLGEDFEGGAGDGEGNECNVEGDDEQKALEQQQEDVDSLAAAAAAVVLGLGDGHKQPALQELPTPSEANEPASSSSASATSAAANSSAASTTSSSSSST
jgi:hypothetical protein